MTLVVIAKQYKDLSLSPMIVTRPWMESLGSKALCREEELRKKLVKL